jgi:NIMA (never in mitosis gene a)-related kinase
MSNALKNNIQNNIHVINPLKNEEIISQNNITPILNYIRELSPIGTSRGKDNNSSNVYYSPEKYFPISNKNSKINKAYFGINNLTINHNTNLTNLNLYFLYNNQNSNRNYSNKQNDQYFKSLNAKEPEDSVRKNIIDRKNVHPLDKSIIKEKTLKTRYHSIRYTIRRNVSKSPLNNTLSLYRRNKRAALSKNKENYKPIGEKNIEKMGPIGKLNLSEFIQISQIGKGTFGKIFSVKWKKNNKLYVLKKEIFNDEEIVKKRNKIVAILTDFLERTKNKGVVQIYSNLWERNKQEFIYYELMELGERDWDKEINLRRQNNKFYTEIELLNIALQLIRTLSLLQKNHITHRDIKPQNVLIVNGKYKLCDFGEIRIMEREGIVVQRIRGSELYMSPILFYGLRANLIQVKHNTYKSDVFSLGMCLLYAATMYFNCTDEIREMTDMEKINIILNKYLSERYSEKIISLIYLMLQIEEQLRPDFIQLEDKINKILII